MAGIVDDTLEQRLGELEAQVRALRTRNPLESASVVNSQGRYVAISSLAFGQVQSVRPGVGVVSLTGPANTGVSAPVWTDGDPQVSVLVTGGKLRVDFAALLAVVGKQARMIMGYSLTWTGPPDAPDSQSFPVTFPDYYRSIFAYSYDAAALFAGGTFFSHEGLIPGWYRARSAYSLLHEPTTTAPTGSVDNPRIAAAPY